jgi:hypothetical protein
MRTRILLAAAAGLVAGTVWAFQPPTAEERAATFAAADADQSGGLSRDELDDLFEIIRTQRTDALFAAADADQSGEVTLAELEAARPKGGRRGRHGGPEGPPPAE